MCGCGYLCLPRQFGWGSELPYGSFFYITNSLTYPLIYVGLISCFHLLSSVRPIFTTIHSYLPNSTAAWFVVATVGAIKGVIANIADKIPDEGTGPSRKESRSGGFPIGLIDKVSKDTQQQPGMCLRAAAGTGLLPAVPPRLQHQPPPYGLFQKPTVPQEVMNDT